MRLWQSLSVLMAVTSVMVSCGQEDQARPVHVSSSDSNTVNQVEVSVPVLPVVDNEGTAWFLATRGDKGGAYQLTAADAHGWSSTVLFDVDGVPDTEPMLIMSPSGKGILAAATRCDDEGCHSSDLIVARYQRSADAIETIGDPWVVQREERAFGVAPRPVTARENVSMIQDSYQVIEFRDGYQPRQYQLPDQAVAPCLTEDGRIVAVEVTSSGSKDDGNGQTSLIAPGEKPSDELMLSLVQFDGTDWSMIANSQRPWLGTYQTNSDFHCGETGPYYSRASQRADWYWDSGWIEVKPQELFWDLSTRSTASGPVGIQDGILMLFDPTSRSASPLMSVKVPDPLSDQLDAAIANSNTVETGLVNGWLAIGGTDRSTGVLCLGKAQEMEGRVDCGVFE